MRIVTVYMAEDGEGFNTEQECRDYESKHPEFALIGLDLARITAALEGGDRALADALLLTSLKLPAESPFEQGRRAFLAGKGGIIPDHFKGDKASADQWLAGWDESSFEAGRRSAA